MFQGFPLEVNQELLGYVRNVQLGFVTWPRAFAFNCISRVIRLVVPCSMKSANNTPSWSRNVVGHQFSSRHHNLDLSQLLKPRIFPPRASTSCLRSMAMNPCHLRRQPPMAYCCRNKRAKVVIICHVFRRCSRRPSRAHLVDSQAQSGPDNRSV